jgi:hypothetical protein
MITFWLIITYKPYPKCVKNFKEVTSLSRNKENILPKKREWYKFNREAELERGRKYKEQTRDKRRAARKLMTEAAREHERVLVRALYRRRSNNMVLID